MNDITIDDFRERISDSCPSCAICGFKAHSLVRHFKDAHNMSVGQYKKLHPKASLVSPIVSELLRTMDRKAKFTDRFEDFVKAFENNKGSKIFAAMKAQFWKGKPEHKDLIPEMIDEFFFDDRLVKAVSFGMLKQKNIYIEGPTGCGKTELVFQMHAQLELPLKRVNMNGDVTVANFIGQRKADPAKGTYFEHGNLPKAMKEGYTLILDEVDYMPPAIAAVMNPVLEGKRMLYIPDTDETIIAAPGFNVIATANTGGKGDAAGVYTGTEIMNTAFLDRFSIKLTADYLPIAEEVKMLQGRFPSRDGSTIQKFVQAANEVRNSFKNGSLPFTISTRKLIDLFEMEEAMGLTEAANCAILNWMDNDNKQVVVNILDRCGVKLK